MRRELIEEELIRVPAPNPLAPEDESLMDADHLPKERKKPGRKKGWKQAVAESSSMWGGNSSTSTKVILTFSLILLITCNAMFTDDFCLNAEWEGPRQRIHSPINSKCFTT